MKTIEIKGKYALMGFDRKNGNYVEHYREVVTENQIVGYRHWMGGPNGFFRSGHDDRRAAWLFGSKYEK